MKKYLNIKDVSKLLDIKEHVIRYWDSIDPKTNKLRIEGVSTKSKGGTRYFNKQNIHKLEMIKKLLYQNGNYNNSLILADKILSSNKKVSFKLNDDNYRNNEYDKLDENKIKKINKILKNIRILLKLNS